MTGKYMGILESEVDTRSEEFASNVVTMKASIESFLALERNMLGAANAAKAKFVKRGQLLPRERWNALSDPAAPFLELSSLAGYLLHDDKDGSTAGGDIMSGGRYVSGVRCFVVATNSAIKDGTILPTGVYKILRSQQVAKENKLPLVTLAESDGANLTHATEIFVEGCRAFANQTRLSAADIPQITEVHGTSTAGGAYQPGLSDYVVVVRGKAKMFLAGPPLLKTATGILVTDASQQGAAHRYGGKALQGRQRARPPDSRQAGNGLHAEAG